MKKGSARSFPKNFPERVAIDTGVLVALVLKDDPAHKQCFETLRCVPAKTKLVTVESCLAELSFLVPKRIEYRGRLLSLLQSCDLKIWMLDLVSLSRVFELQDKYRDLPMDFADAALMVACEQLAITHVLTLDRRDFSIFRPRHCERFVILPR